MLRRLKRDLKTCYGKSDVLITHRHTRGISTCRTASDFQLPTVYRQWLYSTIIVKNITLWESKTVITMPVALMFTNTMTHDKVHITTVRTPNLYFIEKKCKKCSAKRSCPRARLLPGANFAKPYLGKRTEKEFWRKISKRLPANRYYLAKKIVSE